jgi:hypothetical protein
MSYNKFMVKTQAKTNTSFLKRCACNHSWQLFIHQPMGWTLSLDWECEHCGAQYQTATSPVDSHWPVRSTIARKLLRNEKIDA